MKRYRKNFNKNMKTLSSYYAYLTQLTKNHCYIGTTNEWIIDNYYLIVEQKKTTKNCSKWAFFSIYKA